MDGDCEAMPDMIMQSSDGIIKLSHELRGDEISLQDKSSI